MPGLLEEGERTKDQISFGGSGSSKLPKGVVLDKDGKPCRTCTSTSAWMAMMKSSSKPSKSASAAVPFAAAATSTGTMTETNDCPPDVDDLGRATWTLLHSLTATYPTTAPPETQSKMRTFLSLFSQFYPCWVCAEDFQTWMAEPANDPAQVLKTQEDFGRWMCRAHNAVNVKLGKKEFDCNLWKQRWKDGWDDGRCG